MAVVSSIFALETVVQADGSRWCYETHTLTGGQQITLSYLSPAGTDNNAIMVARAPVVAQGAKQSEADETHLIDAPAVLVQQTMTQYLVALRARFRTSDKADACYLAWWVLRRIADGSITDAQCQTAFNLTAVAWTTAKTNNLTPRSNAWASIQAAKGI